MRLRRLDLTRYGHFTDAGIDFGEKVAGAPDLHVVYGPNEAGKSTAFAAFLDLLFGIAPQSPYGFLHPYATMRIGGALDFADGARTFARIKRAQNSLLDGAGSPIGESEIRVDLGGIDRDAYRTMFSLDDETLEKGGDSILASRGDLGELLFSAGAGLADLSRKLGDLRARADQFYKYRARTGTLAELKGRLAALKAERERFDTLAADYARLIEDRDTAVQQYDAAIHDRAQAQARIEAIGRQLAALPRLTELRGYRDRLSPLHDLPDAPASWAVELPGLRDEEIALEVRRQGVADTIARQAGEIEGLAVDSVALGLAEPTERLAIPRARDAAAEKELPERHLELREAEIAVAGLLVRLERPGEAEPGRLVLGASTIGRLRALIESRSGLDAALRGAETELNDATRALAEAEAALRKAGGEEASAAGMAVGDPTRALAATLADARASNHAARQHLARRTCAGLDVRLAERLKTLAPWRGDADALAEMRCPAPATVQDWKARTERARTAIALHAAEVEARTTEVALQRAASDGFARSTGLVGDQEAALVRGRREQAWASHRRALDAATGDAFEAALREDDLVTAGRLGQASELAMLRQSERALALALAKRACAGELAAVAEAALGAVRDAVADAVRAMAPDLGETVGVAELEVWLASRDAALAERDALVAARTERRDADAEAQAMRERLRGMLATAGMARASTDDLGSLLAAAQDLLDREAGKRTLRAGVEERRRDLSRRQHAVAQAQTDAVAWGAEWGTVCRGCWLGEAGNAPDLAAVREILAAEADLGPALEKRAGLADRVARMERDQRDFRSEVVALAKRLDIPVDARSTGDLDRLVGERIGAASVQSARRAELLAALATERAGERTLAEARTILQARVRVMTAHFGVASLEEVAAKLAAVAVRADLRERATKVEREILDGLGSLRIAEAERILDATDRPALEAEIAVLRDRHRDLTTQSEERFAARGRAIDRVEAIGGDSTVAVIEERRRTTLLEIEEGAERYLHLRAGTLATEHGLRAYRERHRSSMMTRASEAFRTISRGAYQGLAAQPGRDGEVLIARSATGGSKAAYDLSKGTRFQLYLALRVAGYHEFVRARAPVPFIADDIMETFDDLRAREAFRLFGDMAGTGQVIYLTHHRHLCEIALEVCPSARIHELSHRPAAAKKAS